MNDVDRMMSLCKHFRSTTEWKPLLLPLTQNFTEQLCQKPPQIFSTLTAAAALSARHYAIYKNKLNIHTYNGHRIKPQWVTWASLRRSSQQSRPNEKSITQNGKCVVARSILISGMPGKSKKRQTNKTYWLGARGREIDDWHGRLQKSSTVQIHVIFSRSY